MLTFVSTWNFVALALALVLPSQWNCKSSVVRAWTEAGPYSIMQHAAKEKSPTATNSSGFGAAIAAIGACAVTASRLQWTSDTTTAHSFTSFAPATMPMPQISSPLAVKTLSPCCSSCVPLPFFRFAGCVCSPPLTRRLTRLWTSSRLFT